MNSLYDKLTAYDGTDHYPYHMPGHKRQPLTKVLERIGDIDITEIEGFDNLHHAEGILKELEERTAAAYGAQESHFLVNGSTGGLLAAISAAVPQGKHLLMARNCHKSAYHGVYLRNLRTSYLIPETEAPYDIAGAITPDQVAKALAEAPDVCAVLVVSPTYEGVVSDIEAIAEVVHARGIPLLVDEAHGAHFGFHPAWPDNSCRKGADIVIHSLHKTLPAPTQTAVLHVNGKLVDRERLARFLRIYQTSSPSYVMMAAMEEAVELAREGRPLFDSFLKQWQGMLGKLRQCGHLRFYEAAGMDIGKLVVSVKGTDLTGQQLYNILLNKYHLQLEMAGGTYVLAMFTLADGQEGYDRLADALLAIDAGCLSVKEDGAAFTAVYPKQVFPLAQAWDGEKEEVVLSEAYGRTAGEFISLYPPGIPLIAPGERFTEDIGRNIAEYTHRELPVQGVGYRNDGVYITVLK